MATEIMSVLNCSQNF